MYIIVYIYNYIYTVPISWWVLIPTSFHTIQYCSLVHQRSVQVARDLSTLPSGYDDQNWDAGWSINSFAPGYWTIQEYPRHHATSWSLRMVKYLGYWPKTKTFLEGQQAKLLAPSFNNLHELVPSTLWQNLTWNFSKVDQTGPTQPLPMVRFVVPTLRLQ